MKYPDQKLNPKWITGEESIDDGVIQWADSFGKHLAPNDSRDRNSLTKSQIRKFYGELKRIDSSYERNKSQIPFLKAKLAYAVGRNRGSRIKDFYEEVSNGIEVINDKESFKRFVSVVESIVAYHKFHGGKD